MLAIIKTGGKQYKVTPKQKIRIEKIAGKEGDRITLEDVLLVADEKDIKIGQPKVQGAKVIGRILKQDRADKVIIFKYKPKKRYRVKRGHRQPFSLVEIEDVK